MGNKEDWEELEKWQERRKEEQNIPLSSGNDPIYKNWPAPA